MRADRGAGAKPARLFLQGEEAGAGTDTAYFAGLACAGLPTHQTNNKNILNVITFKKYVFKLLFNFCVTACVDEIVCVPDVPILTCLTPPSVIFSDRY